MKINFGKYIFIIIVSILIIISLYVYYESQEKNSNHALNHIENKQKEYSNILNLAICNFDTINPLITKNKDVINISKLIFEPLIGLDENYKIEYVLAKECAKISNKSYIIKLNNEIEWQDGKKLTSKDVEFTINQIKKIESIYSKEVEKIESVEIIDDSSLKINLEESLDFFEYYLDFPILPNHIYENDLVTSNSKIPLGTGRFKIKNIEEKNINLEKNQYYRKNDEENSKIEQININLYNNEKDVYCNFQLGNIDLINVASNNYQEYISGTFYNIKEYKGREYDFISLNCKDSILSMPEVRKAISYAINKNQINEIIDNKYYIANFPLDYGSFLHNETIENQNYDIEKIKKTLEEAGWFFQNNNWKNKKIKTINLSLELIVQETNLQRVKISEEIKKQLEEIGIHLEIKKVSDNKYMEILSNKKYQMVLTGINNGFSPSLDYFFGMQNLAQYENEELINIINEVSNIQDENILKQKYNQIIEIANEENPYIPLYRNKQKLIFNQNLNGEIMPNNYNIFYKIWTWNVAI